MSYIGSKRSSSLVSATEITLDGAKLKSSGDSITKSDGTTAVLSESSGTVTFTTNNAVIEGSSSGDLVRITQTGSGNALVVEDSANPDSTPFVVTSIGRVGVGTIIPTGELHLKGADQAFRIEDTSSGNMQFGQWDGSNNRIQSSSRPFQLITTDSQPITLYTNNTERMRIDSSGTIYIYKESVDEYRSNLSVSDLSNFALWVVAYGDNVTNKILNGIRFAEGYAGIYGYDAGGSAANGLGFFTGNLLGVNEVMSIDSSGNVKINNLGTGTVYSSSGVLTNTNPSDLNLKENIVEVGYGLSEVKQLRPVEFDWIADEADKHELGFIAQEVQLIIPDLVNTYVRIINEETGETEIKYGLESTQFIPVLVKAIQEQQTLIESQQSQIDALTTKTQEQDLTIASLISRIEALETQP